MLDKRVFLKGLNYLKAMYLNWQFNLTNKMLLEIWYDSFNQLDDETYIETVKQYCKVKQFAPNSPYDILNSIGNYQDKHSAWETILDVINRSINNSMFLNLMYKEQPSLYEFVKNWNIETVEQDRFGNKCYDYCFGRFFKRDYEKFLEAQNITKINGKLCIPLKEKQLRLEQSNQLAIEFKNFEE